jgi:hypothetical protein
MNALYSLYDALISIEVPADRARAVVSAMEQDMTTVLATKTDLANTQLLLRQELHAVRDSLRGEMATMRDALRGEMVAMRDALRQEMGAMRDSIRLDMDHKFLQQDQKFELLRSSMTIRLGSMLFLSTGLLFAALKLT